MLARLAARSTDGRTLVLARGPLLSLWRDSAAELLTPLVLDEPNQVNAGPGQSIALDPAGLRVYSICRLGEALNAQPIGATQPGQIPWSSPIPQGTSLAISRDGRTLAVAGRSGEILLVDADRGTIRATLPRVADDPGPVDALPFSPALGFSPDGKILAVGSREQIRLWAVSGKPTPIVRLPGHRGSVRSLAFDASGDRLAGADEKTVKVWDLAPLRGELARIGLGW
jgi:WD40 repeat protein